MVLCCIIGSMDFAKVSDEALVSHVQKNDGKDFEFIIDRYQTALLRYAVRMTGDRDLAEDIVQETFISAFKNINGFEKDRKFSSWIYRITHNKAVNELKKTRKTVDLETAPGILSPEDAMKIEKQLDEKNARRNLKKTISRIPLKYREPLLLRYLEEKSYEEISDILKIPTGTVGVRIKRGLEKMREETRLKFEDYL